MEDIGIKDVASQRHIGGASVKADSPLSNASTTAHSAHRLQSARASRSQAPLLRDLTRRLVESEWHRGCAMCCGAGTAMRLLDDMDDACTRHNDAEKAGCGWRLDATQRPILATYLRNGWAELGAIAPSSSSITTTTTTTTAAASTVVRADVWDAYWAHFSLHAGPRINESLSAHLAREQSSKGGGVLTTASRRRVLLKAALTSVTKTDTSTSPDLHDPIFCARLEAVLLFHARHIGAIEFIYTERGIVHVQFTTARAAQYFQCWVETRTVRVLTSSLNDGTGHHSDSPLVSPATGAGEDVGTTKIDETLALALDAWGRTCGGVTITAVLAPADERRVTATLLLGPHVRLATAHAQSLLAGMLEADEVRYQQAVEGFTARFRTTAAARVALHVLQFSLWKVFGVSLLMI